MIQFNFIADLQEQLRRSFPQAQLPADWIIVPEKCPPEMVGDLTINCFRLVKVLKSNPEQVAATVEKIAASHPEIERVEKIKAFVNLTVKGGALHRATLGQTAELLNAAYLPADKRSRVMVEYSSPNTNKPQHLGHVRNNTIGMSLAALLKRVGHEVFSINLVNDRGIHICKSMLAYQRFGNGATPASTGIKGDHFVGDYYVKFNQALKQELEQLRQQHPEWSDKNDEELFLETEIGKATQKMLQDWENDDSDVRQLWQKMNSWVFDGFNATYQRMGIKFDRTYLESQTYLLGKDLIATGLQNGVFSRRNDGAVIADLGKIGQKVVLRSDGTSVYITQDIGTTLKKFEDFHPDTQVWVVGDEQILHFNMLFAILKKMNYPWADQLFHLAYGMVNLPSGKMKSREGTVVDADDLFDEMVGLAAAAARERAENADQAEIAARAEIIGMGALKFMLLKFNPKTTITFDPQASVKFEGDTGPYLQYVCARIKSIIRKAAELQLPDAVNWDLLERQEEKDVATTAFFYPNTLLEAASKMDVSVLAEYLLSLAKSFNRFYRECPVLTAGAPELVAARLALCQAVNAILTDGLNTMTIGIPDAM